MPKRLAVCFCFFCVFGLTAQKVLKKTLVDSDISSIVVDAKNCFQVNLKTTTSEELRIEASIEGEYSKDLVVNLETKGKSIFVSTGFHPNFIQPNDKLSAHKYISIALNIKVPEHKEVAVFGTHANVNVKGDYRNLTVKLADGDCTINEAGETVHVVTQKGDIWLTTSAGVLQANSDYGKVYASALPKGDKHYVLQSKEGNIYLNKTK